MKLFQLVMQNDEAWHVLNDLGRLNCIHFIDLNPDKLPHEQKFAKVIKTIDETEKRLEYINHIFEVFRFIEQECKRHHIDMPVPETEEEFHRLIEKLC